MDTHKNKEQFTVRLPDGSPSQQAQMVCAMSRHMAACAWDRLVPELRRIAAVLATLLMLPVTTGLLVSYRSGGQPLPGTPTKYLLLLLAAVTITLLCIRTWFGRVTTLRFLVTSIMVLRRPQRYSYRTLLAASDYISYVMNERINSTIDSLYLEEYRLCLYLLAERPGRITFLYSGNQRADQLRSKATVLFVGSQYHGNVMEGVTLPPDSRLECIAFNRDKMELCMALPQAIFQTKEVPKA